MVHRRARPEEVEPASPALTDDEVARDLELRLNDGWHAYTVRRTHKHHELYEGMSCKVKFSRFVNGRPCILVLAQVTLFARTKTPMPFTQHIRPRRDRWFFPGLEDVEEAVRLYGRGKGHMLPY